MPLSASARSVIDGYQSKLRHACGAAAKGSDATDCCAAGWVRGSHWWLRISSYLAQGRQAQQGDSRKLQHAQDVRGLKVVWIKVVGGVGACALVVDWLKCRERGASRR